MLNLAILFSLVVLLNLGNSVESGVAVENKIDTRFFGGPTQPDKFDNYNFFFLFSKDYQKILFVTINLLGK